MGVSDVDWTQQARVLFKLQEEREGGVVRKVGVWIRAAGMAGWTDGWVDGWIRWVGEWAGGWLCGGMGGWNWTYRNGEPKGSDERAPGDGRDGWITDWTWMGWMGGSIVAAPLIRVTLLPQAWFLFCGTRYRQVVVVRRDGSVG